MPIIKSAIKRAKQSVTRRQRNLVVKRAVKDDTRALIDSLATKEAEVIDTAFREVVSEIDRAVKKGTLHKNTAARRKSRLSKLVVSALVPEDAATKGAKPKAKGTTPKKTTKAAAKPAAKKAAPKKKPTTK
jgi:ribosomal protein S20